MNVNVNLMEQNVSQINGGISIKVNVSVTKIHICDKEYVWNPSTCICENEKYLESIMGDSAILCDDVINPYDEEIKAIPTNFDEKI